MWPLETWSLQVMWSKITGVAAFSDKTCENLQQEKSISRAITQEINS